MNQIEPPITSEPENEIVQMVELPPIPKLPFNLSGSITIHALGNVVHEKPAYHNKKYIYPVGFKSVQTYTSYISYPERTDYINLIEENGNAPRFRVIVADDPTREFYADGPTKPWMKVKELVQQARKKATGARCAVSVSGQKEFGLYQPDGYIMSLIRQLPNADKCKNLEKWVPSDKFLRKHGLGVQERRPAKSAPKRLKVDVNSLLKKSEKKKKEEDTASVHSLDEDSDLEELISNVYDKSRVVLHYPVPDNPEGCARLLLKPPLRNSSDKPISLIRLAPFPSNIDNPVRTSLEVQYTSLCKTNRLRLTMGKSLIHGWGAFAGEFIRAGEVIVEYTGELIRNSMTELRERQYRAAGIECYMFRLDTDLVIDATMKGNIARLANHSCDPNAESRNISANGEKHIVLVAKRDIQPFEEITYDYNFNFEDEKEKVKCGCGSKKCRIYMN